MFESLFFWSGVVVWCVIAAGAIIVACLAFFQLWDRTVSPSLGNLRFAIFGKGYRNKGISYYKLWSSKPKYIYRHVARGAGRRNFGRLAMKRLVREARRESLRGRGK